MARRPGFSVGAALVLALGIGANTTIYSFVKALLLPTAPIEDSRRVVRLWSQNLARGSYFSPLSEADVAALKRTDRSFVDVAAYTSA